jgi:hypothetical protein
MTPMRATVVQNWQPAVRHDEIKDNRWLSTAPSAVLE